MVKIVVVCEFGFAEGAIPLWLAETYYREQLGLHTAKLWGPCGGPVSKLKSAQDPETWVSMKAAHQARCDDYRERMRNILAYARENGLVEYGEVTFSPGGRKPKGYKFAYYE